MRETDALAVSGIGKSFEQVIERSSPESENFDLYRCLNCWAVTEFYSSPQRTRKGQASKDLPRS